MLSKSLRSAFYGRSCQFIEPLEVRTLLSGLPFDPSFDDDGIVEESDLEVRYEVTDHAVQPDGKIVVVGTRMQPGGNDNIFIRRFNADGSIDNSFSGDGLLVRDVLRDDWATSVAVTTGGKILVAGSFDGDAGSFILSYNANGTSNTSFGNSGSLFTNVFQRDERNNDILVDSSGNIFVTGYIGHVAFLSTYTSAGNIRARQEINVGFDDHVGMSIALTDDGGVIVAGNAVNFPNRSQIFVSRFDLNGLDVTPDSDFGTNGTLITNPTDSDEVAADVEVQSSGRIIVGGSLKNSGVLLLGITEGGELDPGFSGDGLFVSSAGGSEFFDEIEVLPNDKIVAAGTRGGRFLAAQFTANGALDDNFSGDGSVTLPNSQGGDSAKGLSISDDGKILLSGNVLSTTFADGIGVARLNSNGTLDTSFGDEGTVKTYESIRRELNAVARRADGKVIAVGQTDEDGRRSFFVTRLHPRGTPDATFGDNGRVVIPFLGGEDNYATDVLLQEDGKIVVGGFGNQNFAVVRLNSDGTRDTTFGKNGKAVYNLGGNDRIFDMELQEDGKMLAVGRSAAGAVIVRYNTDGSLDDTFGTGGISRPVPNGTYTEIKLDPEGKIVIGGSVPATGGRQFALFRLKKNGALDTSFGGGVVATPFAGGDAEIRAIDIAADGTILAAGDIEDGTEEFALAKYTPDGAPDNSFSGDGKTKINLAGVQRVLVLDARVRDDGSVVVGGTARTGEYDEVLVAHVLSDGSVNPAFGAGGYVTGSLETAGREPNFTDIRAVTMNPDGSLLATARIRPLQVLSYVIIKSRPILSNIDAELSGGVLTVRGTSANNGITVTTADGVVTVNVDGGIRAFDAGAVDRIDVFGGAGNDTITLNGSIAARVSGQSGNDSLTGGAGDDTINGGDGDDRMFGENGRDILDGGNGADLFRGGDGKDTADYSSRTGDLTIGIGTFADDGEAGEKDNVFNDIERVLGGSGNDQIKGGANNNELHGGAGNDTLIGLGGRDALFGQGGADLLRGNDGEQDYLDGGGGSDTGEKDSLDTTFSVEQFI